MNRRRGPRAFTPMTKDFIDELFAMWMHRAFAGPSERFDHEQRFWAEIESVAPHGGEPDRKDRNMAAARKPGPQEFRLNVRDLEGIVAFLNNIEAEAMGYGQLTSAVVDFEEFDGVYENGAWTLRPKKAKP